MLGILAGEVYDYLIKIVPGIVLEVDYSEGIVCFVFDLYDNFFIQCTINAEDLLKSPLVPENIARGIADQINTSKETKLKEIRSYRKKKRRRQQLNSFWT